MSGRKGKGNSPHGYFETSRALRRRLAAGKGLQSSAAPVLVQQATVAKRKGVQHG